MPINTSGLVNRVALGMIAYNQRRAAAQEDLSARQNAATNYADDAYRKADEAVNKAFYDKRRYLIDKQYKKEERSLAKQYTRGTPEYDQAKAALDQRNDERNLRLEADREYGTARWVQSQLQRASFADAIDEAKNHNQYFADVNDILGNYHNEIAAIEKSNKAAINAKFGLDEKGGRK